MVGVIDDGVGDLGDPPPELLRRLDREVPRTPGLAAAMLELGGLPPDEDLPPLPLALRRRRGRAIPPAVGTSSRVTTLAPASSDEELDLGIEAPPGWRPGGEARARHSSYRPADDIGGDLVDDLARRCAPLIASRPRLRYVWDQRRRWVFDLAWPHPRVAVLIDAGVKLGGRTVYGAGWVRDAERLNEAVIDGWMVLRVTAAQVGSGAAVRLIARALASPWKRV